MKKILYNNKYGGFGFSDEVLKHFGVKTGWGSQEAYNFNKDIRNRTKKEIIELVEKIGLEKASGDCCRLAILEVDDEDFYEIDTFDGKEQLIYKGNLKDGSIIY